MERAVLDQLAGYFISRLAGYPTTLDEDEILVTVRELLKYFTFISFVLSSCHLSLVACRP